MSDRSPRDHRVAECDAIIPGYADERTPRRRKRPRSSRPSSRRQQWRAVAAAMLWSGPACAGPAIPPSDTGPSARTASLLAGSTWSVEANEPYANLGHAVAAAGDVDGDGYGDVVVGVPWHDGPETDEGQVHVYLGSPAGLSSTPAWSAESNQPGAFFGEAVASAGDVNGDGYDDVIVGAPGWDGPEPDEGRVFVYFGSVSGLAASPGWTAEVDQPGAWFGEEVAGAGDIDGDGYDDVLVGAILYDDPEVNEGGAFLFPGSAGGPAAAATWDIQSDQPWAQLGSAVASAGDVNGDGYDDVVVGAAGLDDPELDEGAVFVHLGSAAGLAPTPDWAAQSDEPEAYLGLAATGIGDANGDGYADVAVAAPAYDNTMLPPGRTWLFAGSAAGLGTLPSWWAPQDGSVPGLGAGLAGGDFNGDAHADLAVASDSGAVLVFVGSPGSLVPTIAWIAPVVAHRVAFAGDTNGDGYADLLFGAPWYDGGQAGEGRALLFEGFGCAGQAAAADCGRCAACDGAGACTVVPADDVDCGFVICAALDTACRDYVPLLTDRCEGLYDCKDSEPADCPVWTDAPVGAACGLCASCDGAGVCTAAPDDSACTPLVCTAGCDICTCGYSEVEPSDCSGDGLCTCGCLDFDCPPGVGCVPSGVIDCDGIDVPCRDYEDLTTALCEGAGDCRDPNDPADCTLYVDAPAGTPCAGSTPGGAACDGAGGCVPFARPGDGGPGDAGGADAAAVADARTGADAASPPDAGAPEADAGNGSDAGAAVDAAASGDARAPDDVPFRVEGGGCECRVVARSDPSDAGRRRSAGAVVLAVLLLFHLGRRHVTALLRPPRPAAHGRTGDSASSQRRLQWARHVPSGCIACTRKSEWRRRRDGRPVGRHGGWVPGRRNVPRRLLDEPGLCRRRERSGGLVRCGARLLGQRKLRARGHARYRFVRRDGGVLLCGSLGERRSRPAGGVAGRVALPRLRRSGRVHRLHSDPGRDVRARPRRPTGGLYLREDLRP